MLEEYIDLAAESLVEYNRESGSGSPFTTSDDGSRTLHQPSELTPWRRVGAVGKVGGGIFGSEESVYGSTGFLDERGSEGFVLRSEIEAGWVPALNVTEAVKFVLFWGSGVVGETGETVEEGTHCDGAFVG